MGITNYIIQTSMYMSQAQVQSDISTSLLKKVMDNSEVTAANLIDQMNAVEAVPNFEGTISMYI